MRYLRGHGQYALGGVIPAVYLEPDFDSGLFCVLTQRVHALGDKTHLLLERLALGRTAPHHAHGRNAQRRAQVD